MTIAAGDLAVTFVDNRALGERHRAGYNGIASLTHRKCDESVFVPAYAGFNLEHIFGGDRMKDLFEPRHHPMELRRLGPNSVELHQSPTPLSSVESWTRFVVRPPHSIDVRFRCVIHEAAFFRHGYAGLFWASYIHEPADRRIHFLGRGPGDTAPRWISAYSEKHGEKSTHPGIDDPGEVFFAPDFNATLANHFSEYRFDEPMFYGRFRDMALIYMFDRGDSIRLSQSPTGGGGKNPAWDFQFLIRRFQVDRPYEFRARIVYKPFESAGDVVDEYRRWERERPRP